jgi:hypothetical protein
MSILDFGGNTGNAAYIIGREILKLPKNKTVVVDVMIGIQKNGFLEMILHLYK